MGKEANHPSGGTERKVANALLILKSEEDMNEEQ